MNYRVGGSGTGPFVASAANGDSWKVEHLKEATDVPVFGGSALKRKLHGLCEQQHPLVKLLY